MQFSLTTDQEAARSLTDSAAAHDLEGDDVAGRCHRPASRDPELTRAGRGGADA